MIHPDNLIPVDSDLAHLLRQWSSDLDDRVWSIANLCNDLIEELEGGVVKKSDVYKAVAARCKGKKPNTIRRWAEVAADFDIDMQDAYKDLLSFDHFKVSRRLFNEGYTPSVDYGLQWCIEGNDDKITAGRFHTVGEMLQHFLPEGTFPTLSQRWERIKESLYDLFLMVDNDTKRAVLLRAWDDINSTVVTLDKEEQLA